MLETLRHIPFFQDLTAEQIALLEPLFERYLSPPETPIFEQGDPATYLYLLIKGEVSIHYKPYDGPPITLTHLRNGDVFGWSAVVGSTHYTSSLFSESQIEAIRIRGKDLLALIKEHPETGKIIMDHLAQVVSSRWKNAQAQVQSLLNSGKAQS